MRHHSSQPRHTTPPLIGTAARITRRVLRELNERLMLFGGWVWIAAASLIGFEAFDILFGAFVLAPELLPLVIIALALGWYFRERIRAVIRRWRIRARAARVARIQASARPVRPVDVGVRTDVRLR